MVSPLDVAWSLLKARGAGRRRQDFREAVDAQFPPVADGMSWAEAQSMMQTIADHERGTVGVPVRFSRENSYRTADGKLMFDAHEKGLEGSTDHHTGQSAIYPARYLTFDPDGTARRNIQGYTNQDKQFNVERYKREHLNYGKNPKRGLPYDTRYMQSLPVTDAGIPSGRRYVDPQFHGPLLDARNPDFEPEGEVIESKPFSYEDLL